MKPECTCSDLRKQNCDKRDGDHDWTAYGVHHHPLDCRLTTSTQWETRAKNAEAELEELRKVTAA